MLGYGLLDYAGGEKVIWVDDASGVDIDPAAILDGDEHFGTLEQSWYFAVFQFGGVAHWRAWDDVVLHEVSMLDLRRLKDPSCNNRTQH